MPTPIQIKNIIMMGDSLSDRGTINRTFLLGCIPMRLLTALDKTPKGRFTNGLVWSDHVTASIANDFTVKRLQSKWKLDATDISDAIISRDKRIMKAVYDSYALDDDQFVNYKGKLWVRSYCEGGLTSHNYRWKPSTSIIRFFTRLMVSTLAEMRKKIIQYDEEKKITPQQKAETLIIEWSGANDLVTVNAKPSSAEVDDAIEARIENVKQLISKGYRNFVLMNMPNLSYTPRYQSKNPQEQAEAQRCTYYFNEELAKACIELNKEYPYCNIRVFDINTEFELIYQNPPQYFFDASKKTIPYIESPDFKKPKGGVSPASGYLFFDDIHPSADLHSLLATRFYTQLNQMFELLEPNQRITQPKFHTEESLLRCFKEHYERSMSKDTSSFFQREPDHTYDFENVSLAMIFRNALEKHHRRTKDVLIELGWLSAKDEPTIQLLAAANHDTQDNVDSVGFKI